MLLKSDPCYQSQYVMHVITLYRFVNIAAIVSISMNSINIGLISHRSCINGIKLYQWCESRSTSQISHQHHQCRINLTAIWSIPINFINDAAILWIPIICVNLTSISHQFCQPPFISINCMNLAYMLSISINCINVSMIPHPFQQYYINVKHIVWV